MDEVSVVCEKLQELDDHDDVLSITCNGKTFEKRVGDLETSVILESSSKNKKKKMKSVAQENTKELCTLISVKRRPWGEEEGSRGKK